MIRLSVLTLLAVALAVPAFGQQSNPATPAPGNPGGMPPGTRVSSQGVPAPHQTNQADRAFVQAAGIGGLAEMAAASLAAEKGASGNIREFAQRMIYDHGAANDRLSALAKADAIPIPDRLDDEHSTMRDELEKARDAQFDRVYIQGQIIDHQKTAQLLEYEIGSGENADLKKFASDVLPTVFVHLRMAQAIAAEIFQAAEAPAKNPGKAKQ
jgi:putative membrane protein